MVKSDAKKKLIKRLIGICVPALVIVITIIMASVSFAWFSNDMKPSVHTVLMTTQKAFILTFDSVNDSETRNINFKGQTAIDRNGRLVTDNNGRSYPRPQNVDIKQYMLDAPYYFITTIALDTDSSSVDFEMILDAAKITSGNSVLNSYDSAEGGFSADDMPYAFTWYFKAHEDKSVNYIGAISADGEDMRTMDYKLPEEDEVWYTPYGKLTFDGNHLIKEVNGEAVDNSPVTGDSDTAPRYSLLNGGLKDMTLRADAQSFDFYIVFAPQKLFWAQFCNADKGYKVGDIYSEDELIKIFGQSSSNQMYYSNMAYFGARFEFGATLKVKNIHGQDQ